LKAAPRGRKGISKQLSVNRRIRAREVRVIGAEGEQLGILPLQKALQLAWEEGLDLVEVAPTAAPPVCRLLDYGKYRYEQTKKDRKAKKTQRVGLLREVRLRPKIEEHDLQAKIRTTMKLLEEGNKVKLVVRFRGREVVFPELGEKVLRRVADASKELAAMTSPVQDGRNMAMLLTPVASKKAKEAHGDAKAEDP